MLFSPSSKWYFCQGGTLASEEVMVQLLKQKCLPILLYALEVCNLDERTAITVFHDEQILYEIIFILLVWNCQSLSNIVWM